MVMDTFQVRLSHGLIDKIDELVVAGIYSNRSDVIRDAVRKLVLDNMVGIVFENENSVKKVRKFRKEISKRKVDLEEINRLAD